MKRFGLLRKPICRKAERWQAAELCEPLPDGANDLWQMGLHRAHTNEQQDQDAAKPRMQLPGSGVLLRASLGPTRE